MADGKKIGAKIVIDGEQEFRAALKQSKQAMKEFDSEMKLVTAQFKDNAQSMEALKAKQATYQKQQQELTKQNKLLVDQIEKANVAYKKAAETHETTAKNIADLEKALEDAKKQYGENSDEVKDLESRLKEANVEYDKQERALGNLTTQISRWNTDLNKTNAELVEVDGALRDTNSAIDNYDQNVREAESTTKKFGVVVKESAEGTDSLRVSLGSLVSAQIVVDVLRTCANAIKDVASAALEVGTKFTASMSNVEALSGASGDALARLTAKAREMGAATIYSASESADALSYMALAGWDAEQMLEGIEPVLSLAAAANMDLAEASDIVTDYITAFGLKAEDASHFSDVMAYAMSNSNTTVELLGESYKNCAATCGSMNIAVEDATAVLSTMANAGVKGGEAGTALNTILTRLATNTKECADQLETYGIKVYDSQGRMNSISSILQGLGEIWGDLSDKEQAALAKTIAGTNQYSKFQTIMIGVSDAAKEGGQSFFDYAEALRDCDGAAAGMAKTMQDNLTGDITILKSALEGLGIATEGVFDESFRIAVQGATDAVSRLERSVSNGDLGVSLAGLGDSLANLTENLIKSAEEALPGFIDGLSKLIDNFDYIVGGVKTAVAGYAAYEVATIAAKIATEGLTVALEMNPIGLLAGVLAAACVGLYEFVKAEENATYSAAENGTEIRALINDTESLNAEIKDSAEARKNEIASLDAQSQASLKLVGQLYSETTSQNRKKAILEQLKDLYPKLNISMDQYGNIIGQTRGEVEKYIQTSVQLAKVEAAKEHLAEIAKQQFEAEMRLAELEEEIDAQREKAADAQSRRNKIFDETNWFTRIFTAEAYRSAEAAEDEHEAFSALLTTYESTSSELKGLSEEYDKTLAYIEDTEPIDEAAAATEDLAEAEADAVVITEELQEEFNDLYEALQKSIEGSLDLTNKWSQDWDTSTKNMTDNIESQIDGITNWGENFTKLADTAEVNIDSRVLKYLADMGTEGAGLVQQLVDTLESSPEELQAFSDKMAEYLTLEDSVAQTITDSYSDTIIEAMGGAVEAAQGSAEEFAEVGTASAQAVADGLADGETIVTEAATEMSSGVADGVKEAVGSGSGSPVYQEGQRVSQLMADGIKAKQQEAADAGKEVAEEVRDAFASILTEEVGKNIGNAFGDALMKQIEARGAQAVARAKELAEEARKAGGGGGDDEKDDDKGGNEGGNEGGGGENPKTPVTPVTPPEGGGIPLNGLSAVIPFLNDLNNYQVNSVSHVVSDLSASVNALSDKVNTMSNALNANTTVNVELSGDAKGIFTAVQTQNSKIVKSTGYHALA